MSMLEQAVRDWGADMGMQGLQLGHDGALQLRMENSDVLGVQQVGDEVVLHYAQVCGADAAQRLLRAMKLAGSVGAAEEAVQVGLRDSAQGRWLVLVQRRPAERIGMRDLREGVEQLQRFAAQTLG